MGTEISTLSVTGGASTNDEICQVFANAHGCEVRRAQTTNTAALGAALMAYRGDQPGLSWPSIVEPFCKPGGPRLQPDMSTRATYDSLIAAYAEFERRIANLAR